MPQFSTFLTQFNSKYLTLKNNFIQVGLRGYAPGGEDLRWMRDHGIRYHFMAEVERYGWDHVMERALTEAKEGGAEYLYISLDIDVIDPAFAPGTGTPEPGGLTPRELFPLLRRLSVEGLDAHFPHQGAYMRTADLEALPA